jgi:hypothetical protein
MGQKGYQKKKRESFGPVIIFRTQERQMLMNLFQWDTFMILNLFQWDKNLVLRLKINLFKLISRMFKNDIY